MTEVPAKPQNGVRARPDRSVERSAVLAEMLAAESSGGTDTDSAPVPASAPEPVPAPAPASAPASAPEPAALPADEPDGTTVTDPTLPDAEPIATADPDLAKRLAVVQKATQRAQAGLARERAEIDRLRAELTATAERVQNFDKLKARAKFDPASVLAELGLTDDDFGPTAQQLYLRSKAVDPKHRERADQVMREREAAMSLAELRKEVQTLRQERERETSAIAAERAAAEYLAAVEKAVSDKAPLVARLAAKNPAKARQRFAEMAIELSADGDTPDPADVIAALEARRLEELADLGLDPATILKPATKTKTTEAEEKRPAKTLGNDLSTSTVPRSVKSDRELRAEALRELEALDRQPR